jgi:hypothetical protein
VIPETTSAAALKRRAVRERLEPVRDRVAVTVKLNAPIVTVARSIPSAALILRTVATLPMSSATPAGQYGND